MTRAALPKHGRQAQEVLDEVERYRRSGADWRAGKLPMFVFHADQALEEVSRTAFMNFYSENAQSLGAFPAIQKMQEDIIAMGLSLLDAPGDAAGIMTSGGTESIFLAVHAAREHAVASGRDAVRANLVLPYSAHPAFDKAARYLGLEVRRTALLQDFRADISALEAAVDDETILIAGSAPSFPHGVFDDLSSISALALKRGLWLHVDACVGGYLAPFVRQLGRPVPDFDFALKGVVSISADLHKYGYAGKPASTVFFRDETLVRHCLFEFHDWPRGTYRSSTFCGTKPGGAVAAAWAVMNFLGEDGYRRHAATVMETRDRLIAGIVQIDGLVIQGKPTIGLFSFGAQDGNTHAIADRMQDGGWFMSRNAEPPGIQFMTMPIHAKVADQYVEELARCTAQVVHHGSAARRVEVTYGG